VLSALAVAAFVAVCVLVAFHVGGTRITVGLVITAFWAAPASAFAVSRLRAVARTDEGWGTALVACALAYAALLVFFFALAFSHPMS